MSSLRRRNLSGAMLDGVAAENLDFREADLSFARFDRARLSGANFEGANLYGASFSEADLSAANLKDANLQGAEISEANGLIGPQLKSARLWFLATVNNCPSCISRLAQHIDFRRKNLSRADLRNFDLRDADLRSASLAYADLSNANLRGARVFLTDFRGATLSADQVQTMRGWELGFYDYDLLTKLKLSQGHNQDLYSGKASGDLEGADLSNLDLTRWSFRGANLKDVNLSGARLLLTDFRDSQGMNAAVIDSCQAHLALWEASPNDGLFHDNGNSDDNLYPQSERNTRLAKADLRNTDLRGCDLRIANLSNLDLTGVDLRRADLSMASFKGSHLEGGRFDNANVLLGDFSEAVGLIPEQIKKARNWEFALLPDQLEKRLFRSDPERPSRIRARDFRRLRIKRDFSGGQLMYSNFGDADLRGSSFSHANLNKVSFKGADLQNVDFAGADLEWADFRGAKNLKSTQFSSSANWESAFLDPAILVQLGFPPNHNEVLTRVGKSIRVPGVVGGRLYVVDPPYYDPEAPGGYS